jgi:general secretion pathway protein F
MPIYQYKALAESGEVEVGITSADSPREARVKLRARKLHVTELLQLKEGEVKARRRITLPRIFRRGKIQDLAIVTRQLATLLDSGIPLMGSLTAVIEQVQNRHFRAVLMDVRERVAQGSNFADALGANPGYFNELYVNMVRAGEASGRLDAVLHRVADYLQAQNRIQARITAALTYPIIMVIIGTAVVIFLLTFVVPRIVELLTKQAKALPLPTEILISISSFLQHFWWVFLIVGVGIYLMYRGLRATEQGRLSIDTFLLEIPLLGPLFKKQAISRFAVTFATLLESGLPVLESLGIVKRVVNNQVLANVLERVRQRVTEGSDISTPLKESKIFPPVVGYMIAIGEESGKLEGLLRKISDAYDEEIELAAQKLTSMLEPLMIVIMAGIVSFIVLSILLPILQMSRLQ